MALLALPRDAMLTALGLIGAIVTSVILGRVRHHEQGGFTPLEMRRRMLMPIAGQSG